MGAARALSVSGVSSIRFIPLEDLGEPGRVVHRRSNKRTLSTTPVDNCYAQAAGIDQPSDGQEQRREQSQGLERHAAQSARTGVS